jgi:hypothetical protein
VNDDLEERRWKESHEILRITGPWQASKDFNSVSPKYKATVHPFNYIRLQNVKEKCIGK